VSEVLTGRITNGLAVAGVARRRGWHGRCPGQDPAG
jgi:hypothetical protein